MSSSPVKFKIGWSTDIGRRATQQDEYIVVPRLFDGDIEASEHDVGMFGVLDGHGNDGDKAAHYIKINLEKELRNRKNTFANDPKAILTTIFATINDGLCSDPKIDAYMSGSTAALVFVFPRRRKVVVAHLGDSRVVFGRKVDGNWKAEQVTVDHNCYSEPEKARVLASGARIDRLYVDEGQLGPYRIFKGSMPYPGLVVSRAFGDTVAKKLGVLVVPEVQEFDITDDLKCIIVGTDGVFEGLEPEEALACVTEFSDPQEASEALTKESLVGMDKVEVDDNTTNVVLYFE